jgi:hypothetical protein
LVKRSVAVQVVLAKEAAKVDDCRKRQKFVWSFAAHNLSRLTGHHNLCNDS